MTDLMYEWGKAFGRCNRTFKSTTFFLLMVIATALGHFMWEIVAQTLKILNVFLLFERDLYLHFLKV